MPVLTCVRVVHANLHSIGHALPRGEECGKLLNSFELMLSWNAASQIRRQRASPSADDSRQSSALGSAIACGQSEPGLTEIGEELLVVLKTRQINRHLPTAIQVANSSFQLNQSVRAPNGIDAFGIQPAPRRSSANTKTMKVLF